MSTINSSTTEAELEAAFMNNASYLEDLSTTKAALFITVCTAILLRPSMTGKGTFSASWNRETIIQLRDEARLWLEARDTSYRSGPTVRVASFRNSRHRS